MSSYYLINSFAFYAAYHQHPVNVIIHQITIPIIVWTLIVFANYFIFLNNEVISWLPFTLALPLIFLYEIIYMLLDIWSALIMVILFMVMYTTSNLFIFYVESAWIYSLLIHIIAWIVQFMGHTFFEKKKTSINR